MKYENKNCSELKKYPKYFISKDGMVYSEKSKIFLQFSYNKHGYRRVGLYSNGRTRTINVHRLVAETFIPNPENKPCVNHINGVRDDNRIENLEWCTYSENTLHAFRLGLKTIPDSQRKRFIEMAKNATGANHPRSKKLINTITGKIYDTVKSAREDAGIKPSTFSAMLTGQNPNKTNFIYHE